MGNVFSTFGEGIVDSIWDGLVEWMLKSFYGTISDVFTQIGGMGAEIFDLSWIVASVRLFACLGWTLFAVGMIVAAFDLAIEYQNGRANVKSTALNVLKGFFAANLVTLAPVELYKFCINLQNVFLKDLAGSFVGTVDFNLGDVALKVLTGVFGGPAGLVLNGLFPLCMLIGLETPGGAREYRVIAVCQANSVESRLYQHINFTDSAGKADFLDAVREDSVFFIGTDDRAERFITLSTCDVSRRNGRVVVVGELVN